MGLVVQEGKLEESKTIEQLYQELNEQKIVLDNRECFIDWVIQNHPAVVKQYLGWSLIS